MHRFLVICWGAFSLFFYPTWHKWVFSLDFFQSHQSFLIKNVLASSIKCNFTFLLGTFWDKTKKYVNSHFNTPNYHSPKLASKAWCTGRTESANGSGSHCTRCWRTSWPTGARTAWSRSPPVPHSALPSSPARRGTTNLVSKLGRHFFGSGSDPPEKKRIRTQIGQKNLNRIQRLK